MGRLVNLALYTLGVVLICVFLLPKAVFALDDFDLYRYGPDEKVQIERKGFIVKLVLYDTEEELNDVYYNSQEGERPEGEGVRAFSMSSDAEDVCFVHIKAAKIWDDRENMAIMGHEVYHCALARHEVATYGKDKDKDKDNNIHEEEEDKTVKVEPEKIVKNKFEPAPCPFKEKTRQQLLDEDRLLELEWLKEDYKKMGIIITE
jgi:hypothetical protein